MTTWNAALWTDGYKLDHRRQYPAGTTNVYSNFTPRASRVPGQHAVVWFGLQAAWAKLVAAWRRDFFARPVAEVSARYAARVASYLGPDAAAQLGVAHIAALHELQRLPVTLRALPEGMRVPLRVPMFTIEASHPDFAWLTNYLETVLSCELWLPCTSATTAYRARQRFERYAALTGASREFVPWQGHDFSMRGMPGVEAAAASGAAHLLSFTGTDTLPALDWIDTYYPGSPPDHLLGGSVAATEHSVMCAGGQEGEQATFERLLTLYPTGIVSVVSDTWDLWHVLTVTLPNLREQVLARAGKLVIRPDSGDPVKIVCGDPAAPAGSPAALGVVRLLHAVFGATQNAAGYWTLDPHVGVIYGDSINDERAEAILAGLAANGYASDNVVLGMGSFTYQYVTRDTYGFAMKATAAVVDGEERELFKAPATDDGTKHSARGRLAVVRDPNRGLTLRERCTGPVPDDLLRLVVSDGHWVPAATESFAQVRARLWERA